MPDVNAKITELEDQVLETLQNAHEPVVKAVGQLVERVEGSVPELEVELPEGFPTARQLLDSQYTFVTKVLELNYELAKQLLDVTKPLRTKLVVEPKPVSKPKAAPKAA